MKQGDQSRPTIANETPLQGWKEIAQYLHRDERTARRWETEEGLPVRRHRTDRRSSVYAYRSELEAWRARRSPAKELAPQSQLSRQQLLTLLAVAALLAIGLFMVRGPILNPPKPLAEAAGEGVLARQIWSGPNVDVLVSPSLDGRFLSHVSWDTGDLAIRDLETGKSRLLTNKGSTSDNPAFALHSSISPDGSQVAYVWANWEKSSYELRVVSTDNSAPPKLLYQSDEVTYLKTNGWSPDGKEILVTLFTKDRTTRLVLVSVEDRSVHQVKTLGWDEGVKASLSPNGRYVAYDSPSGHSSGARDIYLYPLADGGQSSLVTHTADDLSPLWTPDGNWVAFVSNRTGVLSLWAVPVVDGQGEGDAVLLKSDIGTRELLGFTERGSLFYTGGLQQDVYVASINFDEGRMIADPEAATDRFVGFNSAPEWSPNGERLAFLSDRAAVGAKVLCIRSVQTGEQREVPLTVTMPENSEGRPRWAPNERSITVVGTNREGRQGIYRIDLESRTESPLVLVTAEEWLTYHVWANNGEAIFFTRFSNLKRSSVVKRSVSTGEEQELHTAPAGAFFSSMALSPSGKQLAFVVKERPGGSTLSVLRLDDGLREDVVQSEAISRNTLGWSADGRWLLFGTTGAARTDMWLVPAQGGEPRKMNVGMDQIKGPSVHPEGSRIAFTAGHSDNELWVLENFLPEEKGTK